MLTTISGIGPLKDHGLPLEQAEAELYHHNHPYGRPFSHLQTKAGKNWIETKKYSGVILLDYYVNTL